MRINVRHEPSEWRCLFLFPGGNSHLFTGIQVWEWLRDYQAYDEDAHLVS